MPERAGKRYPRARWAAARTAVYSISAKNIGPYPGRSLKARARLFEKLSFLLRGLSSQNAIAMRVAAETLDDVVVTNSEAVGTLIGVLLEER